MRDPAGRSIKILLALLFVSVGVGIGLALKPGRTEPAPMTHTSQDSEGPRAARDTSGSTAIQRPLRSPMEEARLQALERTVAELRTQSGAAPPAPVSPPPRLDREKLKQMALEQRQAQLLGHERQAIDPTWASEATRSFSADFSMMTQGQAFRVRALDCKTTTCVARVEWPSYAEAAASYQFLLHHSYGMDCARNLMLPEPEDPTRAYAASLILECQNLRR